MPAAPDYESRTPASFRSPISHIVERRLVTTESPADVDIIQSETAQRTRRKMHRRQVDARVLRLSLAHVKCASSEVRLNGSSANASPQTPSAHTPVDHMALPVLIKMPACCPGGREQPDPRHRLRRHT